MRLPEYLRKGGIKPGPPEDFPKGSVDRAKALTIGIVSSWKLATTTEKAWQWEVDRARKEDAHSLLGFQTFDDYLKATIGETTVTATEKVKGRAQQLAADPEVRAAPANGEVGRGRNSSDNVRPNPHGNSAEGIVRRLKRDAPEIASALARGEYKSARAAGIAAGIVKVPTAFEAAKKVVAKLSKAERRKLLAWLQEQD